MGKTYYIKKDAKHRVRKGEEKKMDFEFIRTYMPLYVEAGVLTLKIAALGIVLSMAIGLICSLIKTMRVPVLRKVVSI